MDTFALCDLCGADESAFTDMFYIPDINQIYCEKCFQIWAETAFYYKGDRKTVDKNIARMKEKFADLGVWEYNGV